MDSKYGKILLKYFPNMDNAFTEYITGALSHNDLSSYDETYEAIGIYLLPYASEESIAEEACRELYKVYSKTRGKSISSSFGELKVLDVPIRMADIVIENHDVESIWKQQRDRVSNINRKTLENNVNTIWKQERARVSYVNRKTLEKTETKMKEKRQKRDMVKATNLEKPFGSARASQQLNKKELKEDSNGTKRSYDVRIENFDISYGDRSLVTNSDLTMVQGRRYGLVGRNGCGKTTLLRLLADGQLKMPSHLTVLHVEQELVGDDTPAIDSVLSCDVKRQSLLEEEKRLNALLLNVKSNSESEEISNLLTSIHMELADMESDKAPARASVIMRGLGFKPESQKKPTKTFSGGWRMRLALAQALFAKPDILLLDEPTNMLDIKAVLWLENFLQSWPSTILVVSHSREFLNSVATDIFHINSMKLDSYRGNYEDFLKTRIEKLKNQQREYDAQQEVRKEAQVYIDRFRSNARHAKSVQSKIKQLEKLPVLVPVDIEKEVVFRFPEVAKLTSSILELDEVSFHYQKSRPIFNKVNLSSSMDSRICIVGENGSGKTTLLKVLNGDLKPASGERFVNQRLKIGYFSQHHVDQMDQEMSPVALMEKIKPDQPTLFYRNKLGSFGITGELAMRPVAYLSGGQKSRVAFALISLKDPNFLILDEPTNHLDMEAIEGLCKALQEFKGGILMVSHDERLIRVLCDEIWICEQQTVRYLEGGMDAYKKLISKEFEL